ncbi:MAG TPA: mechanosensitive ion channel family protein [Candidatus Aquilonibacter sp.]|nr:mechanosensitive ion channel family protein [Candidatus Aquilonibacter sp.]
MTGTAALILIIATGLSAQQPKRPANTPTTKQGASGKQPEQSKTAAASSTAPSSGTPQSSAQANAQGESSSLPPLQLDGSAVLHHLNQLISWYRHATTEVQSAGLPSDAIYQENTRSMAEQAVKLAFQSARAEAALITAQQKANNQNTSQTTQQQNLQQLESKTASQIEQLQSQIESLNQQIGRAAASRRAGLISQRDALQGQLELQKALLDALQKMASFVENNGEIAGGLEGSINQLAKSIPEVLGSSAAQKPATPQPASSKPSLANSGGLISEAITLYDYMSAVREIDSLVNETDFTRGVADHVRTPLRNALRATIQESQTLANQPPATNPQELQQERQDFQNLTDRFKQLSGAMLPLSQEIVVLDDVKTNFEEWHGSILRESKYVLRSVLLRVSGIVLALIVIFVVSEIWRRITFRYIGDPRRRRQFLVMRRVVIGVLIVIVLIFGFVSEFSSLATFAGFITAGIAVGLQAVLLSVAAYFFIIGRYGIRVGDRISVAGVTGDVVDIGLVRLYMMELAGTGVDFYPTGRIVVFSNSVLFQAGTPLFKQIPGTEYSWHEVVVQITPQGNHKTAQEKLVAVVNSVYSSYRDEIQRQHEGIERRVDIQLEVPHPDAHLQFADTGLELLVRYPVDIRKAPEIDEEMTRKVLELVETDEALKAAVSGTPKIRSVVKG